MGFSFLPIAPVDVAVGMGDLSSSMELLVKSLSGILRLIFELNDPNTFPLFSILCPLSLILSVLLDVLEVVVPVKVFTSVGVLHEGIQVFLWNQHVFG